MSRERCGSYAEGVRVCGTTQAGLIDALRPARIEAICSATLRLPGGRR